jgi:CTP:molybdopterin cytidylyltransferase MocA
VDQPEPVTPRTPSSGHPADARLAGVLLAAAAGAPPAGPPALVELDGELLVERGVRVLTEGGCDRVVVVLGADADEVRSRARLVGAQVVVAPTWERGLSHSLAAGLGVFGGEHEVRGAVVARCDQPGVGPEAVRRLAAAWRQGAQVAVATSEGQAHDPVLLDRAVWMQAAASSSGDEGAWALVHARPELAVGVPCDGTGHPGRIAT